MTARNAIESLESRRLFASTSLAAGLLRVNGDKDTANTITIGLNADKSAYDVNVNGTTQSYAAREVNQIIVHGGRLGDTIRLTSTYAKRNALFGESGNDWIEGVAMEFGDHIPKGWVKLSGGDGDDTCISHGGTSFINGDAGNDKLVGSTGADLICGHDGNDTLFGNDGRDTLLGGAGNDSLLGGGGMDSVDGGSGNDYIQGGESNDAINAGAGDDTIFGDSGDDALDGGTGKNLVFGDSGADVLTSSNALDTLIGGSGPDTISGVAGTTRVKQSTAAYDALNAKLHALGDALKQW